MGRRVEGEWRRLEGVEPTVRDLLAAEEACVPNMQMHISYLYTSIIGDDDSG